jgi:hypothetical protein
MAKRKSNGTAPAGTGGEHVNDVTPATTAAEEERGKTTRPRATRKPDGGPRAGKASSPAAVAQEISGEFEETKDLLNRLQKEMREAAAQAGEAGQHALAVRRQLQETQQMLDHEAERLAAARRQGEVVQEEVRRLGRELNETQALLQAVRQEAAETAPQTGELRRVAVAFAAELEEVRRQCQSEVERLADLRAGEDAVRQGLAGAEEQLLDFDRRFGDVGARLAEQMAAPLQRTELEFKETRGRLQALRQEMDAATGELNELRRRTPPAADKAAAPSPGEGGPAAGRAADRAAVGAASDIEAAVREQPREEVADLAGAAKHLGVTVEVDSAAVVEVEPGSPAEKAGLKPGDVIRAVNRQPVHSGAELRDAVEHLAPDENAVLQVERPAPAAEASAAGAGRADAAPLGEGPPDPPREEGRLGAMELDAAGPPREPASAPADAAAPLGMTVAVGSTVILGVAPGSRAAWAGLRPGDRIIDVNDRPVTTGDELREAVSRLRRDERPVFQVVRGAPAAEAFEGNEDKSESEYT